jgi:hypothetical protein
MSIQTETTLRPKSETDHTPDSTSNGEKSAPDSLQEKQDGIATEHAGEEPVYLTGFRLSMVMTTIFLVTLLAALDIVSPWTLTTKYC